MQPCGAGGTPTATFAFQILGFILSTFFIFYLLFLFY